MATGANAGPVASVQAALAGIDLGPLRAWLTGPRAANDAVDIAGALRAIGVPDKLLPRAEDRGALTVSESGVRLEAKELGFRFGSPRFVPAQVAHGLVATLDAAGALHVSLRIGKEGSFAIEGALGERVRVVATKIEPSWLIALVRALTGISRLRTEDEGGAPGTFVLPQEARFGAELVREGATSLTITMNTAASTLSLGPLSLGDGDHGVLLEGHLAVGDVYRMNVLPAPSGGPELRPLASSVVELTALLRGPLATLSIAAFARAARVELGMHEAGILRETSPVFVIEEASALLAVDRQKLVWQRLGARAYGGAIGSEGVLGLTEATRGVSATASLRDVNAGELPIDASRTVSLIATGRLALDLRVANGEGSGALRLTDGVFPVLARGQAPLAKVGLRLPSETASAPATCSIGLSARGWTFDEVYAAVPGCIARGRLDVDPAGTLDGALTVALGKELLETSTMTSLLTERLTIPVRITGGASAPVVDADLAATFGSFMTSNRVAAVFRSKESVAPPAAPVVDLLPLATRDPSHEAVAMRAWVTAGADWNALPR